MVTIIYGKSWGERGGQRPAANNRRSFSIDPEKILSEKIEQGNITDKDIQDITKSGDSKMLKKLTDKADRQLKKKTQLEDKLGISDRKCFQGVDNSGCLYSDIPLNKLENG